MHRPALRFRSCYRPRLRRCFYNIHVRRLSSASNLPAVNSDKQAIESLEPWQDSSLKALARREEDTKDIIVDDLSATLEAHRTSNRAAVIRKIKLRKNTNETFLRPLLGKGCNGDSEVKKTHEGREDEPHQIWPADSVQAKERYGKTGSRGFVKKTDPLEYTGVAQWPKPPWKINQSSKDMSMQRPWLAYMKTLNEDYCERLTSEIKAYEAYMRLSLQEEAASQLVISDVNSVARNESNIQSLTLIGSRSTGLATPISDFDFTFTLPQPLPGTWILPSSEAGVSQAHPLRYDTKLKAAKTLRRVLKHFRRSKQFSNTDFVQHARVPIVRCKHIATGLDVQIQTLAPYQAAQEHIAAYMSEFPSLRPLYIIIRYCLEVRGLTTTFEGGLGSYSIFMAVVTAMKHSLGKLASDDLGGQLLHVLEFYGNADLYKTGFSVNPPRVFEKQEGGPQTPRTLEQGMARTADSQLSGIDQMQKYYPRKPYLLCLQDPANDQNDLGKNAYAIKHIQAIFNKARGSIQALLKGENEKLDDDRAKGGIWSCLDSLVRADYRAFEIRRSKVERYRNPSKLDGQDYSKERINMEFKKRLNRFKGLAEEDDDHPEPAPGAIAGNAARGIEVDDGLSDDTRRARSGEKLTRAQARRTRNASRPPSHKTIAAKAKEELQKLQGTNDDEYGWTPSSPSDAVGPIDAQRQRQARVERILEALKSGGKASQKAPEASTFVKFTRRRTMKPSYKRKGRLGSIAWRLEPGAVLPQRQRDQKESSAGG